MSLDVDVLCSEDNPSAVRLVMREWGEAESPSIYWLKKLKEYDYMNGLEKMNLDFSYHKKRYIPLVYSLPLPEALSVCKDLYRNNIANVVIEISEESVMKTKRDFSITFAEQLSIISMF